LFGVEKNRRPDEKGMVRNFSYELPGGKKKRFYQSLSKKGK